MRALRPTAASAVVALVLATSARPAGAQVHWDASVQAGGLKRWLTGRPDGAPDATFGGQAQIAGHVALLPLVRVGGYGTFDVTGAGDVTRFVYGGGAHAKVFAPLGPGSTRLWLFTGLGLLGVSTTTAAGGRFLEVPLGLGGSRKVWGPHALMAELGVRIGVAHGGSLYDRGVDAWAVGLSVGFLYDR